MSFGGVSFSLSFDFTSCFIVASVVVSLCFIVVSVFVSTCFDGGILECEEFILISELDSRGLLNKH